MHKASFIVQWSVFEGKHCSFLAVIVCVAVGFRQYYLDCSSV